MRTNFAKVDSETGKVRKVELRERGVGVDTWDAEKVGYVAKR